MPHTMRKPDDKDGAFIFCNTVRVTYKDDKDTVCTVDIENIDGKAWSPTFMSELKEFLLEDHGVNILAATAIEVLETWTR